MTYGVKARQEITDMSNLIESLLTEVEEMRETLHVALKIEGPVKESTCFRIFLEDSTARARVDWFEAPSGITTRYQRIKQAIAKLNKS